MDLVLTPQRPLLDNTSEITIAGAVVSKPYALENGPEGDETNLSFSLDESELVYGEPGDGDGSDGVAGGVPGITKTGGSGDDNLNGGKGDDRLSGEGGDDFISGGGGNDSLEGGGGRDLLQGGEGEDTIFGGHGNDRIEGGLNDDWLGGGDDNDSIMGGPGNDLINGGPGDDTLSGGSDDDRFIYGPGEVGLDGAPDVDTITDFEKGQNGATGDQVDLSLFKGGFVQIVEVLSEDEPVTEIRVFGSEAAFGRGEHGLIIKVEGQNGLEVGNDVTAPIDIVVSPGTLVVGANFDVILG